MRKSVTCRNVIIGGNEPISIQSMTNVNAHDEEGLLKQINRLKEAGCDIVRLAIPDRQGAETLAKIRKKTDMPLVADIHFDYRLAIFAIRAGADKIRINPGNIGDRRALNAVVDEAKAYGVPIRIGVNSGSLEKDILEKNGGVTAEGLAESALRNVKIIEDMGYDALVLSMKSSDVWMNYRAHKIVADKTDYPIHIGITEAGTLRRGKVKSAIGIGALLLEGIGNTLRVSLTADPVEEVRYAKEILEALEIRKPKVNLVSCPTCGRTKVKLQELAEEVEQRLEKTEVKPGLKVAVMGCAVNGPGEAKEADFGIAGGEGRGLIFSRGKIIKTVSEDCLVDELMKIIEER